MASDSAARGSFERVGDLEIPHHDLRFQRRTWSFERAGQIVLAAVIVLGLLGVFADGPLSDATKRAGAGGPSVSYPRFMRLGKPEPLTVRLGNPSADAPRVSLAASYLDGFDVESVVPEPQRSSSTADTVTYVFEQGTRTARFVLTPDRIGIQHARVQSAGAVKFTQIVWP